MDTGGGRSSKVSGSLPVWVLRTAAPRVLRTLPLAGRARAGGVRRPHRYMSRFVGTLGAFTIMS